LALDSFGFDLAFGEEKLFGFCRGEGFTRVPFNSLFADGWHLCRWTGIFADGKAGQKAGGNY
jgi:hypothetical protein